ADIRTDDGERDARNHSLFDDVECFHADRSSITHVYLRIDDGERDARNHYLFDDVECFDADRGSITHVYLWIDEGEYSDVHNTRPRANERGAEHCLAFVGGHEFPGLSPSAIVAGRLGDGGLLFGVSRVRGKRKR